MFTTLLFIGCAMAAPLGNSFDANHSVVNNLSAQDQPFVANSLDSSNNLSRRQTDDDSIYFPDDQEDTGIRYPYGSDYRNYLLESSLEQQRKQEEEEGISVFARPSV